MDRDTELIWLVWLFMVANKMSATHSVSPLSYPGTPQLTEHY